MDRLSLKFAIFARSVRRETLDIGCGEGLAAAAVLERGGYVLALDADPLALERVRARILPEQRSRLRTAIGALDDVEFDPARFAAIHAARADIDDLERALRKILDWLQPYGKVFLSTGARDAERLRTALTEAGFAVEDVETYPDADQSWCGIVARRPD